MAKKRKLVSKSQQQQPPPDEAPPQNPPAPEKEEDKDVEFEEQQNSPENDNNAAADDEEEPISKLLEPFTKDQLISLLSKAAESHSDVVSSIRKIANEDTIHRKIFVHGLGYDTTTETLKLAFSQYGDIEDCKSVADKLSGKSKGYGFILFRTRAAARKALREPQKKIGNRMTSCQLAAMGPAPGAGTGTVASEYTQRKIYVSNVSADIDVSKLRAFFERFGEIEEGPLGLDKFTGRPKGFCLFVYKSIESSKKALEEPHKDFEGHVLHCQKAIDGPKPGKQQQSQVRGPEMMGQFNHGAAASSGLNPALGQALTVLLGSQGAAGLGLNNLLGAGIGGAPVPAPVPAPAQLGHGYHGGGYGSQQLGGGIHGGGYATQAAYPNQQMGRGGGSGRVQQYGYIGGVAPYSSSYSGR